MMAKTISATRSVISTLFLLTSVSLTVPAQVRADFGDKQADRKALPQVPPGFEVTVFAAEPLVRQPCSLAFDTRGRLFVGMGPQYRNPTPQTPGDSVVIVLDSDGDGRADQTKTFATGFNAVQGLAWHGRDLWVANAPDLTVVRDLNGDDEADEYVLVYTDLGNLEHGLHGLQWAPDGKLYMSKGNSKGLTLPGRIAPKPFRELWGVTAPPGTPDHPEPQTFRKETYRHAYHDPADDWGLDGGILRCDDGGRNLEIVCRGFRNPWDIAFDSSFNWLGTDNDQVQGDRVFMPFFSAHFGWNHPWSSHWSDTPHPATAPVSGPLFEGSGTGLAFGDSPTFPETFRNVFFINDWLRKTTFVWRPQWDGALMRPQGGDWEPFIVGGNALYRPTDIEFGPDGALWVLGWSSGYGAEWQAGQLINEGRIFRIQWKGESNSAPDSKSPATPLNAVAATTPLTQQSLTQLVTNLAGPLAVWRIDSQDELLRRGASVKEPLITALRDPNLTETQATWIAWTIGKLDIQDPTIDQFFVSLSDHRSEPKQDENLQLQAIRILGYRMLLDTPRDEPIAALRAALQRPETRLRFAAVQAISQFASRELQKQDVPFAPIAADHFYQPLLIQLVHETDPTTFYAGWQTLRKLASPSMLRSLLTDLRPGVRRAALLALLETRTLARAEIEALRATEQDSSTRAILELGSKKVGASQNQVVVRGKPIDPDPFGMKQSNASLPWQETDSRFALVNNVRATSQHAYRVVAGALQSGTLVYTDRGYRLTTIPESLRGLDLIQTANEDDDSRGAAWLEMESILPVRIYVGIDRRQREPQWIRRDFQKTEWIVRIDEGAEFYLFTRDYPAGPIVLGGNTDDGKAGGKGNYLIAIEPLQSSPPSQPTSVDDVLVNLDQGDAKRGEILFHHPRGAGCAKCHRLDKTRNAFGPNLAEIGTRVQARHLIQSILEPSAVITEGFTMQTIITDDGQTYAGVLLEESGLSVALGLPTGERVDIPKPRIDERQSSKISAMPSMALTLAPQQVADLTAFLLTQKSAPRVDTPNASRDTAPTRDQTNTKTQPTSPARSSPTSAKSTSTQQNLVSPTPPLAATQGVRFAVQEQKDRLLLHLDNRPIAEYVFADAKILRPFFAQVRTMSGLQVTRNHPPQADVDATDHDTMHPGIWLGFGDISGEDFWRNRGRIEHLRFVERPRAERDQLQFTTESRLLTAQGAELGRLINRFRLAAARDSWRLDWEATFESEQGDLIFGDQEEMGFAARMATSLTEKKSGRITSSTGAQTAATTWGQTAAWCDYAGQIEGEPAGIMLIPSPQNFRPCWWHNRDYGVFVANPFGRAAMKQGPVSSVRISKGETFRLAFTAIIHEGPNFQPNQAYANQ